MFGWGRGNRRGCCVVRARWAPYGRGANPRALRAGGREVASRLQEMVSPRAVSFPAALTSGSDWFENRHGQRGREEVRGGTAEDGRKRRGRAAGSAGTSGGLARPFHQVEEDLVEGGVGDVRGAHVGAVERGEDPGEPRVGVVY